MAISTATAKWNGKLKDGKGEMSLGKGAWTGPFSFATRMEGAPGTTPEELIAAALAGCYSMALSADLEGAGFPPESVNSTAKTNFSNKSGNWSIDSIDLEVLAKVPYIDDAKFQEVANGTKSACPVSRALTGTKINVNAKLS